MTPAHPGGKFYNLQKRQAEAICQIPGDPVLFFRGSQPVSPENPIELNQCGKYADDENRYFNLDIVFEIGALSELFIWHTEQLITDYLV